jgi:hypothetical protein
VNREEVETRLAAKESLRSIARSLGVTYQTLQYHRRRWGCAPLRAGSTSGEGHASWRGGSYIDRWGYRMVRAPERGRANPYVPEHVLVAEKAAGRQLKRSEVVHHIDGDKLNNTPGNLLICTRSHHKKLHAQLEAIAFTLLRSGRVKFTEGGYSLVS